MTAIFTIGLSINMPDTTRLTKKLINMYFSDMPADIGESALALSKADATVLARKFANLTLKRADIWAGEQGHLKIFALLSVSSDDSAFLKQVFASYMESFPAYLKKAADRYFSTANFPAEASLLPADWKLELNQ